MNRLRTLTLGVALSLGLCSILPISNASAQSKFSSVIISNPLGTTTLTPSADGLIFSDKIILKDPDFPGQSVSLLMPIGGGDVDFTFPSTSGTLLTAVGGTLAIGQGGTGLTTYAAGDLLVGTAGGVLTKLAAGAPNENKVLTVIAGVPSWETASGGGGVPTTRTISTTAPLDGGGSLAGDRTLELDYSNEFDLLGNQLSLKLDNNNNWGGLQAFATDAPQGNHFIQVINAGSNAINTARLNLTGYATTASLASYGLLAGGNTWAGTQTFSSTIAGSINGNAATATNSTQLGGHTAAEFVQIGGPQTVTGTKTFSSAIVGSVTGNAATATTSAALDAAAATGLTAITAVNLSASGSINAAHGGTGQTTFTAGDILYATGATTLAKLSFAGNANGELLTLVGGLPSWEPAASGGGVSSITGSTNVTASASTGAVTLSLPATITSNTSGNAAGLSATLVATSGGTGQSVYTVGDLLYASSTTALSKLPAHATVGHVLTNNGTGVAPTWQAAPSGGAPSGTTTQTLRYNASNVLIATSNFTNNGTDISSTGKLTATNLIASSALGASTTPTSGGVYQDNAIMAWGEVTAAGGTTSKFGNVTIAKGAGTGIYTITLPASPTAAVLTATTAGQVSNKTTVATATRAGAVFTVQTYRTDNDNAVDVAFYFMVTGRP